ncbi:hypothetical protein [Methylorubrum extorquens]|uniref:hypothetical protein n=1 Tax=Methylorubrum extorquens TaxID=408 RepID=UPI00209E68B9|nr:hypothetical protein [Methylorubrum extorquens]MCP1540116.1 hypothetical protein [Methylorubrum extorquens]
MSKLNLSLQALEIATQAWLAEWRKVWIKRCPHVPCPIRAWEEYSPAEQHHMMKAVKAAFTAAQPDNVAAVIARREA